MWPQKLLKISEHSALVRRALVNQLENHCTSKDALSTEVCDLGIFTYIWYNIFVELHNFSYGFTLKIRCDYYVAPATSDAFF